MSTKFELSFETDNAAFADDRSGEIARILRQIAANLDQGRDQETIFDVNGNVVGKISDWSE